MNIPAETPAHASPIRALLWNTLGRVLFRATFHNHYALRRAILRAFGAHLSPSARVRATARIRAPWNLTIGRETSIGDGAIVFNDAPVTLGDFVTISQYAMLWASTEGIPNSSAAPAHNHSIIINTDAWIATDAFVGPGTRVGEGAILASRAVALAPTSQSTLQPWTIHGGDPAKPLKPRDKPVHPTP